MGRTYMESSTGKPDRQHLKQILAMAGTTKESLMGGIAAIRRLEGKSLTTDRQQTQEMIEELSKLTLAWDEVQRQVGEILAAPDDEDEYEDEEGDNDGPSSYSEAKTTGYAPPTYLH